MWITHWLFEPETTPANGEVSTSEVSSSVRCRVLLWVWVFGVRAEVESLGHLVLLMGGGRSWSDRRRTRRTRRSRSGRRSSSPAAAGRRARRIRGGHGARLDPDMDAFAENTSDPQKRAWAPRGNAARARAGDRGGDADERARGPVLRGRQARDPAARGVHGARRAGGRAGSGVRRERGGGRARERDPRRLRRARRAAAAGEEFIVRKERKEHGLQRWIEGPPLDPGSAV